MPESVLPTDTQELKVKLLDHVTKVLSGLDLFYAVILYFTASHPWLSICLAMLLPLINMPCVIWSNHTGRPYIQYSLTFTLIPVCLVIWFAGVDSPGWILCFSTLTATQIMVDRQPQKYILLFGYILAATLTSAYIGKGILDLLVIFVVMVTFTILLNQILDYLMSQNQELQQVRIELEQTAKAKDQFLSNMNHELRTPMNGVLGTLQLLGATNINEQQRKYIDRMNNSGQHLLHIINDILDISKLDSGQFSIECKPFSLCDSVGNIDIFFEHQLLQQGNELTLTIDENLPDQLLGDGIRLQQILINLIGNANKFTQQGLIKVKVSMEEPLKSGDDNELVLLFEICDSGIGIPLEQQSNIFEQFTQVDNSSTRQYGGTGLGLAICRQLVTHMGGDIWLESAPFHGTCFYFTLPLKVAKKPAVQEGTTVLKQTGEALFATQFPLNILVAEDNMINQLVVTELLSSLGYQIDIANNGLEVLEMVEDKDYQLIFMDIQMPHMDGIEACRRLKQMKSFKSRPVIYAMTANTMAEDIEQCLTAGMKGHVAKPVDIERIKAVIVEVTASL